MHKARATAEMAAANTEKIVVMRDQAALQLFSIPDDSAMSDMAREYLQLRREEELTKVKQRIQQMKADFACSIPIVVEPPAERCAMPHVSSPDGIPVAGGASVRLTSEVAGKSMSTRESTEDAPFSVQASISSP